MPPFLTSVSRHNSLKHSVAKSFCSSFRYNSRNLERPWYGPWCQVLTDITEEFDNMVVVPQFPLWFIEDDRSDEEGSDDSDEDSLDELDVISLKDGDEQDSKQEEETDEDNNEVGNITITTDTVGTIPGSGSTELFPDFVILHVRAKRLPADHSRFRQLGGIVITHQCCPVIVENKKAPSRRVVGSRLRRAVDALLEEAQEQLGTQCYHLFEQYPHALTTIAIAAAGDYWTFRKVHRYEIPRAIGDTLSTVAWDRLEWLPYAQLSSSTSDGRLREIHDTLRAKPTLDLGQ